MLTTLFKKQIGMGSSSDSNDRFSRFLVNQKPVGFEMKFPMKFPIDHEVWRQEVSLQQERKELLQVF